MSTKEYIDRAIQTDNPQVVCASVQVDVPAAPARRLIAAVDIRGEPTTLTELILSPPRLRHQSSASTHSPNAYRDQYDDIESGVEDDVTDMATSLREYKRKPLPYKHFPTGRTLKSSSARIVSLPETSPLYSAKKVVQKTMRVVSQPEHMKSVFSDTSSSFSERQDLSYETLDPFVSESHHRARVRVRSQATDMPQTPSPPSSPESVVIIADRSQLPKGFLRSTLEVDDLQPAHSDDDGWITWAKSPPRPIPALHGPLSLPYARCPSGAEGTIIEEQENLPRMIWGLEGEDVPNIRHRPDSPPITQPAQRKAAPLRSNQPQVPPRFQKLGDEPQSHFVNHSSVSIPKQASQYLPVAEHRQIATHKPGSHADIDFSLPGHGPIDLSDVLRPRRKLRDSSPGQHDVQSNYGDGQILDPSMHVLDGSIAGDWQAAFLAQEHLKSQPIQASTSVASELSDYLTTSVSSSSLSSLQSLASSRSPVAFDSFNRLNNPTSTLTPNLPRRMSALEIAQNYRQQQLGQKSFLPTPPNSSSPLWASRFSPYQGSLVSPDLLAVSGLPAVSAKHLVPQDYQHLDLRHQHNLNSVQLVAHAMSPVIDLNSLRAQARLSVPSLAPAAHIQDPVLRTQDLSAPLYMQDALLDDSANLQHFHPHRQLHARDLPTATGLSPGPPRPPPNTPMSSISHTRRTQIRNAGHTDSATVVQALPSPPSPSHYRPRNESHQERAGLPLSHVLSRRLSSVPEEDAGAYVDTSRSPSPVFSTRSTRSRSFSTSGQRQRQTKTFISDPATLHPENRIHVSMRTPSPGYDRHLLHERNSGVIPAAQVYRPPGKLAPGRGGGSAPGASSRGKNARGQPEGSGENMGRTSRGGRGNRARGAGRGGKRGHSRTPSSIHRNGPERVDGGLSVRS
ncbi:hypothetical protein EIP91_011741 [Steccherinum ochraceum]|uniref:Uncharacterized protein n=1 Tax=Steccherinum ochraceum TaxID=92696 RepID=A0A4R0RUM4_9APHY|nr:hypothetical protein EIP91_011741 [Steccherinum ochraceum]